MIIANPMYDSVFKYLMEDLEAVRTKMDMEDEVERSFMAMVREKDGIIEAKEQVIADQAKVIADLLQKLNQQAT